MEYLAVIVGFMAWRMEKGLKWRSGRLSRHPRSASSDTRGNSSLWLRFSLPMILIANIFHKETVHAPKCS